MLNARPVRQRQGYRSAARPKGPLGLFGVPHELSQRLERSLSEASGWASFVHVLSRAKAREFVTRARFPTPCDLFPARGNARCGAWLAEPATREEWRNDGRIIHDDLLSMRRLENDGEQGFVCSP